MPKYVCLVDTPNEIVQQLPTKHLIENAEKVKDLLLSKLTEHTKEFYEVTDSSFAKNIQERRRYHQSYERA